MYMNEVIWLIFQRYNARLDWLALGHYSPVMPTRRLWAWKDKEKSPTMNNLLTFNVRSSRGISNLNFAISAWLLLGQYCKISVCDFPEETSLTIK